MDKKRTRQGITLIELLAVIVIIGILGGLILPAVQNARRRARVAKAQSEIKQLKVAWRSYVSTYMHRIDSLPTATEMDTSMVRILMGDDDNYNPDGIRFMDFPVDAAATGFLDPWGEVYQVSIGAMEDTTRSWVYATRVYPANRDPLQ